MAKKNISKDAVQELFNKTSTEQLREFLENEFEKDAGLRQRFADFVNKPAVKLAASEKFEADIENEIEDIIEDAEGRYGFIDYHASHRFENEMSAVLSRISAQAPTDELRVRLQMYIVRQLGEIAIDDSDGVISGLMYTIMDDFQCIYENEDSREMLFEACMEYLKSHNCDLEFCADEVEDFVLQFEGEDFAKRIEKYLDTKIKALAKETNDWKFRSGAKKYVAQMLRVKAASKREQSSVLELPSGSRFDEVKATQGAEEKELLEFAKPFWKSNDVRQFFVERYVKEERFNEAISLLEEGLLLDKEWAGIVSDHQKQLKDLYSKTGQKEKYIKMLHTLIESSWDLKFELFDELKSQYSAEEWEKEREGIFRMKSKDEFALAMLLHHEGLTKRLAELILNAKEPSTCTLDEFVPDLPEEFVPQILSAYEKAYNHHAARANKRSDYEHLIFTVIKSVHKIKGGKELTDRLTQQWLEQYKRRPAFCEVIRTFRANNGM